MMEHKLCESCKEILPNESFIDGVNKVTCKPYLLKDCQKCYKKKYYQKNRSKALARSKIVRDKKREAKKISGTFRYGTTQKEEREKFLDFIKRHNINEKDLSDLQSTKAS